MTFASTSPSSPSQQNSSEAINANPMVRRASGSSSPCRTTSHRRTKHRSSNRELFRAPRDDAFSDSTLAKADSSGIAWLDAAARKPADLAYALEANRRTPGWRRMDFRAEVGWLSHVDL